MPWEVAELTLCTQPSSKPNEIRTRTDQSGHLPIDQKTGGQPLIKTEQEIRLSQIGFPITVRLNDIVLLSVSLLANQVKPDQPWSIRVAVNGGGGLQTASEEFPVEAPAEGYQESVTLDRQSPKPSGWSGLYQGGVLYVKIGQGYGRVEIRMVAGDNKVRMTTYFNPSGSRNLESW